MERGERYTMPIQGEMALRSEKEKNRKFQAKCKLRNFEFIPCIMETQGQWGESLKQFVNQMIKKQSTGCDVPYSSLMSYWTQRLSVAMQTKVSQAQMITANKVHAARLLDETEDGNGFEIQNHVHWEDMIKREDDD